MQTKHIEKLEELKGFEWDHNEKEFILEPNHSCIPSLKLIIKNFIAPLSRKFTVVHLFDVSEKNLTELEFYGLKVVLNEKPKLTREEKEYIEAEWYIARDKDNKLFLYHIHPNRNEEYEEWEPSIGSRACAIDINRTLFPFITWESGKAWSKSELMELEVVE